MYLKSLLYGDGSDDGQSDLPHSIQKIMIFDSV